MARCEKFGFRVPVLAGFAALMAAGPASAASRLPCDRVTGRTVAANEQLRVFVAPANRKTGRETALAVCATKSRKVTGLVSGKQSVRLAKVAISGSTAAAVDFAHGGKLVGNNPGVAYTAVRAINVTSRRVTDTTVLIGLIVREIAITPDGLIAIIGNPFGRAVPDDPDNPEDTPENSLTAQAGVFLADGRADTTPTWNKLDTDPAASLTGLGFSESTLVWQNNGVLKNSAPPT